MDKPPEVEPLLAANRTYMDLLKIEVRRLDEWHVDEVGTHFDQDALRDRAKDRIADFEKELADGIVHSRLAVLILSQAYPF